MGLCICLFFWLLLLCEEILSRRMVFMQQQKIKERQGNHHLVVDILWKQESVTLFYASFLSIPREHFFYASIASAYEGNCLLVQWDSPPPSWVQFWSSMYEINSNVFQKKIQQGERRGGKQIAFELIIYVELDDGPGSSLPTVGNEQFQAICPLFPDTHSVVCIVHQKFCILNCK